MVFDLRSDTVTRPDAAMRAAMAEAAVGDDVLDGDPTTRALEERLAALLGQERALFFPSGIMANQTALAVLGPPGTEVLCEQDAHVLTWEEAAAAAHSGLQLRGVPGERGRLTVAALDAAWRPPSRLVPRVSILELENTHLSAGGAVLPVARFQELVGWARERKLAVHLDGARLWHAHVATGCALREWGALADTVMVTLSKGLGCPVGSVLAGSEALIDEAWRVRRRMGGGLRQSGMLAAAGLFALERNLPLLSEDHEKARLLACGFARIPSLRVTEPETNVVMIDLMDEAPPTESVLDSLARRGVRLSRFGERRVRAVTHRDFALADVERVVTLVGDVLTAEGASP